MEGSWQGRYDTHIDVIGDKHGDAISDRFAHNKTQFMQTFLHLQEALKVPIFVIQTIRNPFDVIATRAIAKYEGVKRLVDQRMKTNITTQPPYSLHTASIQPPYSLHTASIQKAVDTVFQRFSAARELREMLGKENVLDVHNCDFGERPQGKHV